jgi:hypothetical protein
MHLPALLPAVVIGALQACRLDFSPRCHTAPHLGRHGVNGRRQRASLWRSMYRQPERSRRKGP